MARIIVKIKGGKSQIEVDGVKGPSCADLTKNIEKALGNVSKEEKTNEFYEQDQDTYMTQGTS